MVNLGSCGAARPTLALNSVNWLSPSTFIQLWFPLPASHLSTVSDSIIDVNTLDAAGVPGCHSGILVDFLELLVPDSAVS
jgi:hypothetical protein